MKYLLTTLLILQTFLLHAQESTFILGKTVNYPSNKIAIKYLYDNFTSYEAYIEVDVNEMGEFKAELVIDHPTLIRVQSENISFEVYVEPMKDVGVFFDANDVNNSIQFFEKDGLKNNEHLKQFKTIRYEDNLKDMSYDDRLKYINEIHQIKKAKLQQTIGSSTSLSSEYKDYLSIQTEYEKYNKLLDWIDIDSISADKRPEFRAHYTHEIINNIEALNHPAYIDFLDEFTIFYCKETLNKSLDYNKNSQTIYACIRDSKEFVTEVKEYILGRLVYFNLIPSNLHQVQEYYDDFVNTSNSPYAIDKVKKRYEKVQKFAGGTAPAFELEGTDGRKINLKDFEGKKVYLSFWAVWCGPCKYEIRGARENRAILKDDIVFIYVSLDERKDTWLNHKVTNEESGTHLWGQGMESKIRNDYGIAGLPTTFLIDEVGNFINNFPKSDTPEFIDFIKKM